ncbi:MAG: putative toxin-antitoxin system toxin component, PIN family [Chloroflexi bacterium]|nr:putative toxin-antitoxin system toxin component, PIN family [Chloroflexota bacterium]
MSSLHFGGRLSELLDLAVSGTIELYLSPAIIKELRGVLGDKFCWAPDRIAAVVETLLRFCRWVDPHEPVRAAPDQDDDRILECALAAGAQFIVSGDRHLLELRDFRGIPILTPRQFLDAAPWKL